MKVHAMLILFVVGFVGVAHAHTVDSVGEYRVEIGWLNEPVVSGETNAIEFFASPLEPCPNIEDRIKCAESQPFEDGIAGLEDTVKMKLLFKGKTITLPLVADHNTIGQYHAFVTPTISGFYQANIIGTIQDTPISLSMHPPKVEERAYIEFPEPIDLATTQLAEKQELIDSNITSITDDVTSLKVTINDLRDEVETLRQAMDASDTQDMSAFGSIGTVLGSVGIALAIFAIIRSRQNTR